jgi:hypothetical protein
VAFFGLLLQQDDFDAAVVRLDRGAGAGGAEADHDHVGVMRIAHALLPRRFALDLPRRLITAAAFSQVSNAVSCGRSDSP